MSRPAVPFIWLSVCDKIVALPTTITGGIGALLNHSNLKGVTAYFSGSHETIKSGENIDMGSVSAL